MDSSSFRTLEADVTNFSGENWKICDFWCCQSAASLFCDCLQRAVTGPSIGRAMLN